DVRPRRDGWSARAGGAPLEGDLRIAARATPRTFAPAAFPAGAALGLRAWRRTGDLARYRVLGSARTVATAAEARDAARAPEFDPERELVLERPVGYTTSVAGPIGSARVVEESPGRVELAVDVAHGGWLRCAQAWFPGWTARVDGREVELLRAEGAFTAVAVPEGEHRVELVYAPASFRIGLWIALVSALAGALLLVRPRSA
ncbi:MAG: YfhO family protein, partial [Planctomycetes bacterium]|nr:YfhO family protein [Planctomycetota bacterium]